METQHPHHFMSNNDTKNEKDLLVEIDRLQQANTMLHKSLLDAQLQIYALETLIEIAEQEWRIEIRGRVGRPNKNS